MGSLNGMGSAEPNALNDTPIGRPKQSRSTGDTGIASLNGGPTIGDDPITDTSSTTPDTINAIGTGISGVGKIGLGIADIGASSKAQSSAELQSIGAIVEAERQSRRDLSISLQRLGNNQKALTSAIEKDNALFDIDLLQQELVEQLDTNNDFRKISDQLLAAGNSSSDTRNMLSQLSKESTNMNKSARTQNNRLRGA